MEVQIDLALDLLVLEVPLVLREDRLEDHLEDHLGVLWDQAHLVDQLEVQNLRA